MAIIDVIGEEAALEQLAEECCELAQACLKLVRCKRGINPTRKSEEECIADLIEEAADVNVSLLVLYHAKWYDEKKINSIAQDKILRWINSINARNVMRN